MEMFARNERKGDDVRGHENLGPIDDRGPLLLPSTLWTPELATDLLLFAPREVATSLDAGTFLCNYLYYRGLERFPGKRVGFLHVVMPGVVSLDRQVEICRRVLVWADNGTVPGG